MLFNDHYFLRGALSLYSQAQGFSSRKESNAVPSDAHFYTLSQPDMVSLTMFPCLLTVCQRWCDAVTVPAY